MSTKPVSPLVPRSTGPSSPEWVPCPPPSPATLSGEPRLGIYTRLRLRRLDAGPGEPSEEETTSQDLGEEGALVRTTLPVARGEHVELSQPGGAFQARLVVHDVRVGRDNAPSLDLRFVDTAGPESVRRLLREAGVSDLGFPASS